MLVEQNAKTALGILNGAHILFGGRIVVHDSSSNLVAKKDREQTYFKQAEWKRE